VSGLKDLLPREYVISIPLIILMVWMGTFPQSFIPSISTSTAVILGPVDAKRDVHVRNALPVKPAAPGASLAKEIADAR
jgi:NADH:ubiquinone oxidoreductase subunit 4 (subunit M)